MNFAALAGLARKDMTSIYDCRAIKLHFPRANRPPLSLGLPIPLPFGHLVINNRHAHLSIAGQQAAPDCDAGPAGHAGGEDGDGVPRLRFCQHDVRELLLHPAGHSPGKSTNPPPFGVVPIACDNSMTTGKYRREKPFSFCGSHTHAQFRVPSHSGNCVERGTLMMDTMVSYCAPGKIIECV